MMAIVLVQWFRWHLALSHSFSQMSFHLLSSFLWENECWYIRPCRQHCSLFKQKYISLYIYIQQNDDDGTYVGSVGTWRWKRGSQSSLWRHVWRFWLKYVSLMAFVKSIYNLWSFSVNLNVCHSFEFEFGSYSRENDRTILLFEIVFFLFLSIHGMIHWEIDLYIRLYMFPMLSTAYISHNGVAFVCTLWVCFRVKNERDEAFLSFCCSSLSLRPILCHSDMKRLILCYSFSSMNEYIGLAYVIQHIENETTRVFVWSDADVSESCLKSAVEHAQTLCASIEGNTEPLQVKKKQEIDDFRKVWLLTPLMTFDSKLMMALLKRTWFFITFDVSAALLRNQVWKLDSYSGRKYGDDWGSCSIFDGRSNY